MTTSKIFIILSLVFFMAAAIVNFIEHGATVITLMCVGLTCNAISKL